MERLDPSHLPPVKLESLNRDHRDQVELLNAALDAMDALDGSDERRAAADEAVEDFVEHTMEHFRQEEDQMRSLQFPAFALHTAEHTRVVDLMQKAVAQWKTHRNADAMRLFLGREFARWLVNHVGTMDLVSAQFIVGQKPR